MHRPAETAPRDARLLSGGVGNMLLATLAFSTMNVFVKQFDRIPATEIVFFPCLVSGMNLIVIPASSKSRRNDGMPLVFRNVPERGGARGPRWDQALRA